MEVLKATNAILVSFQVLSDVLDNPPEQRGWQTKPAVRKMKYALNRHGNNFKETIDSLLGPFADEESAFAELCEKPRDEKWKDMGLANAIAREYARSHVGIRDTLGRMRTLLDDIHRDAEVPLNHDRDLVSLLVVFMPINRYLRNTF